MNKLEEAAAIYEIEKSGQKHRVTMRIIERRFGLKHNQLANYFANANRKRNQNEHIKQDNDSG